MVVAEVLRVLLRSRRAKPERPCSSIARAEARAKVPAPPVMTAFPVRPNRARARSEGVRDAGSGGRGSVSGLAAVESFIVGIMRDVRASRASLGSDASPILTVAGVRSALAVSICGNEYGNYRSSNRL